jgi:hypothetical protein
MNEPPSKSNMLQAHHPYGAYIFGPRDPQAVTFKTSPALECLRLTNRTKQEIV